MEKGVWIMNYVNEDKTVITLPVPLGTEVYVASTGCGDFCLFQQEKFCNEAEKFPTATDGSHCSYYAPCHTTKPHVITTKIVFENLDFILKEWGKRIFDNEDEAMEVAEKSVIENRKQMESLGFFVDSIGYGKTGS